MRLHIWYDAVDKHKDKARLSAYLFRKRLLVGHGESEKKKNKTIANH